MNPWRVLHVSAKDGSTEVETVNDDWVLGPLDLAARDRGSGKTTVIGSGPLSGRGDVGSSWLVAVGPSAVWNGILPDFLGPGGPAWSSLGVDALVIHGRSEVPAVLGLEQRRGQVSVDRIPVGDDPWRAPAGGSAFGVDALRTRLVDAGLAAESSSAQALLTGPASKNSRLGSLRLLALHEGDGPDELTRPSLLVSRGGLGSRLLQQHGLAGLVFGGDPRTRTPLPSAAAAPEAAGSAEEFFVSPTNMVPLREWLTYFNGRSIYQPRRVREELYEFLVARSLLPQFEARAAATTLRADCSVLCRQVCQEGSRQYRRSDEPILALGPLLGVFSLDAVEALSRYVDALGVDLLEAAGLLAWVMECLDRSWLQPDELGVSRRPRWSPDELDPEEDSAHNARLAGALLEALFLAPKTELARLNDLRSAATRLGGAALDAASFLGAGERGWLCPAPLWAPDALVPTCVPVRGLLHDRYEYLPPRELGLRAGRWLILELTMANLGFCPEQRRPSLEADLRKAMSARGAPLSWDRHHRRLAVALEKGLGHRCWIPARVQDQLLRYLLQAQLSLFPDQDLDRWVARMMRDRESACRAYFEQLRDGVREALRS